MSSGYLAYGGGISADSVRLDRSEVIANLADSREHQYRVTGSYGGGIYARELHLGRSTIASNVARASDNVQGGSAHVRVVDAFNSTIVDNLVRDRDPDGAAGTVGGGGLWLLGRGTLEAVTISGNKVAGSGVGGAVVAGNGNLTLSSSLVVGNAAANGDNEISGTPVSLWPSLVGGDGRLVFAETTRVGPGVFAGMLADNGGPTPTAALSTDPINPALDVGDPDLRAVLDQRQVSRDADPDLGAIEAFDPVLGGRDPEAMPIDFLRVLRGGYTVATRAGPSLRDQPYGSRQAVEPHGGLSLYSGADSQLLL